MKCLVSTAIAAALFSSSQAYARLAPVPAKHAVPHSAVQRTTFVYAIKDGQPLHLDRFVDDRVQVKGRRPVILFLFGAGWEGPPRKEAPPASGFEHFTSMGYEVIVVDYRQGVRIAKERKEFTPANGTQMYLRAIQWGVEDLFDATTMVLKHADEWNVDKDEIVLMGGSAGATDSLVAEYNVANETDLARTHLPPGFRYAGVISMAGAFWLKANTPLTFKTKPAPIMFFHGAKDQLVTYDEVQGPFSGYGPVYYFRKFAGPDYPKWFVDYPQGDHLIAGLPAIDELNEMDAFLEKLVKEHQQVSIHTVEEDKIPKIFANAAKLLPPPAK